MATALPANKAAAKQALVRIVFMTCSPEGKPFALVGGCERYTGAHFADGLVDHAERALAVAALVRGRRGEFGAGALEQANAGLHVRLGADGVADTHAGGDRDTEQDLAGRRVFHVDSPREVAFQPPSAVVLERGTLPAAAAGPSVMRAGRPVLD